VHSHVFSSIRDHPGAAPASYHDHGRLLGTAGPAGEMNKTMAFQLLICCFLAFMAFFLQSSDESTALHPWIFVIAEQLAELQGGPENLLTTLELGEHDYDW
jgi:hypothetical protein